MKKLTDEERKEAENIGAVIGYILIGLLASLILIPGMIYSLSSKTSNYSHDMYKVTRPNGNSVEVNAANAAALKAVDILNDYEVSIEKSK